MQGKFPHEVEVIEFVPPSPQLTSVLCPQLKRVGIKWTDSVFKVRRTDSIQKWQSDTLLGADIYFQGKRLYLYQSDLRELPRVTEEESDWPPLWDRLTLDYSMAYLPAYNINEFTRYADIVSQELGLPILYKGAPITPKKLNEKFHDYCELLEKEYGGAGSKTIRQFIEYWEYIE